ncbi:MAG: hypothetical protein WCL27_08995 [Betaproteobacteria bacterium]
MPITRRLPSLLSAIFKGREPESGRTSVRTGLLVKKASPETLSEFDQAED